MYVCVCVCSVCVGWGGGGGMAIEKGGLSGDSLAVVSLRPVV
jgi:hypothetical protein